MPRCHRASEVRRAIERKLDPSCFRGSKELNYWLELDGKKVTRVTVTKSNDGSELAPRQASETNCGFPASNSTTSLPVR